MLRVASALGVALGSMTFALPWTTPVNLVVQLHAQGLGGMMLTLSLVWTYARRAGEPMLERCAALAVGLLAMQFVVSGWAFATPARYLAPCTAIGLATIALAAFVFLNAPRSTVAKATVERDEWGFPRRG